MGPRAGSGCWIRAQPGCSRTTCGRQRMLCIGANPPLTLLVRAPQREPKSPEKPRKAGENSPRPPMAGLEGVPKRATFIFIEISSRSPDDSLFHRCAEHHAPEGVFAIGRCGHADPDLLIVGGHDLVAMLRRRHPLRMRLRGCLELRVIREPGKLLFSPLRFPGSVLMRLTTSFTNGTFCARRVSVARIRDPTAKTTCRRFIAQVPWTCCRLEPLRRCGRVF